MMQPATDNPLILSPRVIKPNRVLIMRGFTHQLAFEGDEMEWMAVQGELLRALPTDERRWECEAHYIGSGIFQCVFGFKFLADAIWARLRFS